MFFQVKKTAYFYENLAKVCSSMQVIIRDQLLETTFGMETYENF